MTVILHCRWCGKELRHNPHWMGPEDIHLEFCNLKCFQEWDSENDIHNGITVAVQAPCGPWRKAWIEANPDLAWQMEALWEEMIKRTK